MLDIFVSSSRHPIAVGILEAAKGSQLRRAPRRGPRIHSSIFHRRLPVRRDAILLSRSRWRFSRLPKGPPTPTAGVPLTSAPGSRVTQPTPTVEAPFRASPRAKAKMPRSSSRHFPRESAAGLFEPEKNAPFLPRMLPLRGHRPHLQAPSPNGARLRGDIGRFWSAAA